jgi:hypothetical protein
VREWESERVGEWERDTSIENIFEDVLFGLIIERGNASEKFEDDDSKSPPINRKRMPSPEKNFRSEIVWSTHKRIASIDFSTCRSKTPFLSRRKN